MAIIISSLNQKKKFGSNKIITVGSSPSCDFYVPDTNFELVVEFNETNNTYSVINNGGNSPLFKGEVFQTLNISKITRLLFENSDEFINFEVLHHNFQLDNVNTNSVNTGSNKTNLNKNEIKHKIQSKIVNTKDDIDNRRIAIIKEISPKINDIKKKLSQNNKAAIFTHFALFGSCFVCAFGVNNYICGLSIQESKDYIHLPTDIKLWILFAVIIMGIMLIFKQGVYGYFYSKTSYNQPKMPKSSQILLITISSLLMIGIYCLNLVYYLNYTKDIVFPLLISIFFCGTTICLGVAAGYYKSSGFELAELLNKFEFREDFEKVIRDYRQWISGYINTISATKQTFIREKEFKLKITEIFEITIGILTAPFLAYGVSNTLAGCFSQAAGWIRISGIIFSPIFLVLATCLIIFAFSLLVGSFCTAKKVAISEIVKHDGFSNYLIHCTEILGLEATNKAKQEIKFGFYTAFCIIIIEFTMNISYFSIEIGQDFNGLCLSFIAALVPTAILIAETYLLGNTKFELYALDAIKSKAD